MPTGSRGAVAAACLIEIDHVGKTFSMGGLRTVAVEDLSFSIRAGQSVAVVGESGAGKTTLGRIVGMLTVPTTGRMLYEAVDVFAGGRQKGSKYRSEIQMVFQDPYKSLNPRLTVRQTLTEQLGAVGISRRMRASRALEVMGLVRLDPRLLGVRPEQLSGGERQRVNIGRALMPGPRVLVLDEPTAGLDMSVRGGILALLARIREQSDITYLVITHDLSIVPFLCDWMYVLYRGRVVESGPARELCDSPKHPYTQGLIAAIPSLTPGWRAPLLKEVPDFGRLSGGCSLRGRCPIEMEVCVKSPELRALKGGRAVACHRVEQ